jgi:hypothetical protein
MSESLANNTSSEPSPQDYLAFLAERAGHLLPVLSRAFDSDAAPEQERSRYVLALYGLANFLRGWNGSDHYSDKLMELASALDDLGDSIQPPLLTPAPTLKGKGRRPEPSAKMRARAFVALALDALLKSGQKKQNAAAYISQSRYKALERLCDKKSRNLASSAREWRDALSAGDIEDIEAVTIFQSVRPTLEKLNSAKGFQQANVFLDEALKLARNFQ